MERKGIPHGRVDEPRVLNCNGIYKLSPVMPIITWITEGVSNPVEVYKKDTKDMGEVLLSATTLGDRSESAENDLNAVSKKHSQAWNNFLRDVLRSDATLRPDAIALYSKSSPVESLDNSQCGHHPLCIRCKPLCAHSHDPKICKICNPPPPI